MNKKSTILLCEDEIFVARSYVRKLEFEGYRVVHAHNGEEALALMKSEKPDLIVLDLMMPLKSGFEVLEAMRASGDNDLQKIPVIVASNLGQKSDIEEAQKLGAVDYLVKSNISLKDLVAKIKKYLPA